MLTFCFSSQLPANQVAFCQTVSAWLLFTHECSQSKWLYSVRPCMKQVNNYLSGTLIALFHAVGWREGHAGGERRDSESRQLM